MTKTAVNGTCECGHPWLMHNGSQKGDEKKIGGMSLGTCCWECGPCWKFRKRKE